jgi:protein TonB
MHFAHSQYAAGSKSTKLAVVVSFHVLLGFGVIKTMSVKSLSLPKVPVPIDLVTAIDPPPTLPPPSALPVTQLPPPAIRVPVPEVPLAPPPLPNQVTTTSISDPAPPVPARTAAVTIPAHPGLETGGAGPASVRMAAMLDGCAKPAYPAQAARNGDSGTVTLALLLGVDGRVSASRITRSSGFRELDRAALTALSLCAFRPAMQGDVTQAGWAQVAYTWTLQ